MKIDRDIPITRKQSKWKPYLKDMEIGDSFPYGDYTPKKCIKVRNSITSYINTNKEFKGYKVSVREHEGKIRVWRTK